MAFLSTLRDLHIEYRLGKPGEVTICCLFCTDRGETEDTRFRLGVNVKTGQAHCYNCGWSSAATGPYWILRKLGEVPDQNGEDGPPEEVPELEQNITAELPEGYERLVTRSKPTDYWSARALRYLIKRGVTRRQIRRHKIGFAMVGRYQYRIIFPVYWKSELLYFVARSFGNTEVRYLNMEGPKPVYGLPNPHRCHKSIVLSEGIFKQLAIELVCEAQDSGAVLGHSVTDLQMRQIVACKYKRVTYWPDPGRPGIKGAVEVCNKLQDAGIEVSTIWPVPNKQADELSQKALIRHYNSQVPYNWKVQADMQAWLAFG